MPASKRVEIALTSIYGIGRAVAREILGKARVDGGKKSDSLTDEEVVAIRRLIDQEYRVEGDLRREIANSIKHYSDIGCYRGLRHRKSLPVHGQRTRTNARTRKGPRRTVAGKKAAPKPK